MVSMFISFFFNEIRIEPNAPNEADSVGVATPNKIDPNTIIINIIGGKMVLSILKILNCAPSNGAFGKISGLIFEHMKIQIKYIPTSKTPGKIAPANKSILLTGSGARLPEIAEACSFAP